MKATERLHNLGQSIWLDQISRDLLHSGTLARYRDEFSLTGLTSNPTIFDNAIRGSAIYDDSIRQCARRHRSSEQIFMDVAFEDIREAADLFRPIYDSTDGLDGWVSFEVSPFLAYDTLRTVEKVVELHSRVHRPNVMIKIPGTAQGNLAIENCIAMGIPINVTLLFSREQYVASAEAYLRGIERRVAGCSEPKVHSVASVFVSRWDKAVMDKVPAHLRNQLGTAIAQRVYKTYRDLLESDRWQRLAAVGGAPQRLLWGSTGTKDPSASDTLYVEALAAPDTIDTIPEKTLLAFADHGNIDAVMPRDGGDAETVLAKFAKIGIDANALATLLQREGAQAFEISWTQLMKCISSKTALLKKAS